ncbi:MAG: YkgJ family cysteine cluster protein [Hadesarchaea archaeon]|nr:YkgJ family cysteine cluster protein [Hadesarchaea archaeon]
MNFRAPKNIRFECQRCARCCGDTSHRGRNILLMESEVERISKHTGLRPLSFASPASNSGHYRYRMKKRNGKCVFLEGKACRIYDIRPLICRFYPFSIRKTNNTYMFEIAKDCPGIGLGGQLGQGEFEKMLLKAQSTLKVS